MGSELVATWRRVPVLVQDGLVALVVLVGWLWATQILEGRGWYPQFAESNSLAMWATVLVLTVRRTLPVSVLLATVTVYPVLYEWELQTEFHLLPILVAGYTAACLGRLPRVVVGLLCLGAAADLYYALPTNDYMVPLEDRLGFDLSRIVFGLFVVAGTVFMGVLVRVQRQTAQVLTERNAELQRLRKVEARQVVVQERARIARELHDIVAHHVSAIVIRAQAASRLAEHKPEVAAEATNWIAGAGQEALTAMRHTVRVLRNETGDTGSAPLAPQSTLADVPAIATRLGGAGLHVDVDLPDPLPRLDPPVDLAAARIVQEALTNVLRHAQARRAVVVAREVPAGLVVEVNDDGRTGTAPPLQPEGHGLRGMAERAAACGGGLDVGVGVLGGWRVTAFLPRAKRQPLAVAG
jgi:signal transduction histidine kinase